jgi:hypothetical protein
MPDIPRPCQFSSSLFRKFSQRFAKMIAISLKSVMGVINSSQNATSFNWFDCHRHYCLESSSISSEIAKYMGHGFVPHSSNPIYAWRKVLDKRVYLKILKLNNFHEPLWHNRRLDLEGQRCTFPG